MSIVAYPPIESAPLIIHLEVVVVDERLHLRSGWGVYIFYIFYTLLYAKVDAALRQPILLRHGHLLMQGETQKNRLHQVPIGASRKSPMGVRVYLLLICEVDGRTIGGTSIVALAIQRRVIMYLKKKRQDLGIADLVRVKNDLDALGMGAVIAVACILRIAAGITYAGAQDTGFVASQLLHAPETFASQNRSLFPHVMLLSCWRNSLYRHAPSCYRVFVRCRRPNGSVIYASNPSTVFW